MDMTVTDQTYGHGNISVNNMLDLSNNAISEVISLLIHFTYEIMLYLRCIIVNTFHLHNNAVSEVYHC